MPLRSIKRKRFKTVLTKLLHRASKKLTAVPSRVCYCVRKSNS
ncbi:Uncharacterised protein [Vibrio cholerae]|nr:Uncharacterised protein [Vibrio cholerae]CSH98761.1 Uncharacterised protein [Vibrio cholerae]